MDIEKYTAGKDKGLSGVELQGVSTLLIKWPDGFDPNTGAPNPPKEQGYQIADITAMRQSAVDAVQAALDAWQKAIDRVAMFDDLHAEVVEFVPQIVANQAAAAQKEKGA